MKGADGNTAFTFFLKNCPMTGEQLTAKLNQIFVVGVTSPVQEETIIPTPVDDVFAEFASAPSEAYPNGATNDGKEISDDVAATDGTNTDGQ